ncbi:hypothetical protein GUJ93_ZPchr0011g27523 [Zizania palustris]|uniref:Uncharacterized protein n=1 Tax=Zizania palustris TaxID=103762 RepID=A0A8J6BS84_ZIZPA|nr:hypothetical protein GUJ93_ZPchr0011g27523 [Zizania palustris]
MDSRARWWNFRGSSAWVEICVVRMRRRKIGARWRNSRWIVAARIGASAWPWRSRFPTRCSRVDRLKPRP